ncbi:MAG TPA: twin-arginine translocation signal domain-containing protein [Candidatus Aminicenantes bacterium]|nr:twin-arginine translocation signal domain-containing protein [Candidatus Aminicenantes bacterium]
MSTRKGMDRRDFIKASAAGLAGVGTTLAAGPAAARGGQAAPEAAPKIRSYRELGRTGFKVSDIGIGTSQTFPPEVLKAALDAGVNYFDTSEGYGRGQAESSIGEAIKGRDRKSFFITTKLRLDGLADAAAVEARLDQSLARLQTDYVDCLLMNPPSAASVKDEVYHQAVAELKKKGKVRFTGAGTHGSRTPGRGEPMEDILLAAVEDGRFDVLLVVYNFLQREPGDKVLEAASKKGLGVTIMKSNPLGRYYDTMSRIERLKKDGQPIDERLQKSMAQMAETAKQAESFIQKNGLETPAEVKAAALKFVLADLRVHTLNLAFNTFEDVQSSLALSGAGLSGGEKGLLASYERDCGPLYCRHACGLCEPSCPHGVPVNTIMRYNHYFEAQGSERYAMAEYAALEAAHADNCRTCQGFCEAACPYGVPVRTLLCLAHSQLTLS